LIKNEVLEFKNILRVQVQVKRRDTIIVWRRSRGEIFSGRIPANADEF